MLSRLVQATARPPALGLVDCLMGLKTEESFAGLHAPCLPGFAAGDKPSKCIGYICYFSDSYSADSICRDLPVIAW